MSSVQTEPCETGWCERPGGHLGEHRHHLGDWHGAAVLGGQAVTVQAILTGLVWPEVQLVMVDSQDLEQCAVALSWQASDELGRALLDASRRFA